MRRVPHSSGKRRVSLALAMLVPLGAFAAPAGAQVAQSPGYKLLDVALAGGGGGEASLGFASFVAFAPLSGAEITSTGFRATLGFLAAEDPQPTNAPVIFGVMPPCGPQAGGTPVTISGLNFDKFGAGPTVTVSIGGSAATGVAVASDTQLACISPAANGGPKDVTVASVHGSDTLPGAFTHTDDLQPFGTGTPGCFGPHSISANSLPKVKNASFGILCTKAPANALGLGIVGNQPNIPGFDYFGILLHVDPFNSTLFLGIDFVSDSSGMGSAPLPIPANPGLAGATIYVQALWAWSSPCVPSPFGLSSTPGLKVTLEP